MSSTLVVHHLRVSQSETIVWLCEELGVAYDLKCYDREQTLLAPEVYKALSPLKTAPVIEDVDTYQPNPEHIKLAESQACVEWISRKKTDQQALGRSLERMAVLLLTAALPKDHPGAKVADSRIEHYLQLIDERLGKSQYLVGDEFTAADLIMVFPLTTMRAFIPVDLSAYSNILRYLKEIGERPAYQRTFEKAETKLKPMLDANPPSLFSM
ncbi:glutathione S-transferase-like protein [Aureobasidium pullulans]|uniref:Glutathione S-transferase-like protein n=1 Tax=Aureobasidium pullulans TaxID=5580 RepID=A0AB38M5K8_AURPU|nr:glutathione S-transferase-like protein [Aureobasidium pullulans]THZ81597.1 glutathione S-transferase-like protein [Aureobasidium pullulans]